MTRAAPLMLLVFVAGGPAAGADATDARWAATPWIEPLAGAPGEAALRAALRSAYAGSPEALLDLARQEAGTTTAGLARLAAAWLLVERGRPAEAVAQAAHADVSATRIADHAAFVLGRALEDGGDPASAAGTYAAAARAAGQRPLACTAWIRAAQAWETARRHSDAIAAWEASLGACASANGPRALLRMAQLLEGQGDVRAAAGAYDRLDREHPGSNEARSAADRREALAVHLPKASAAERASRQAQRGLALFESRQYAEAEPALRAALAAAPRGTDADLLRTRYGRALLARRRTPQGLAALRAVPADSPHAAEAAFAIARAHGDTETRLAAYEDVATRYRGSPWAEEALLSLAGHYQRDARDAEALPYYRRLVEQYPDGRYSDRSAWRAGWGDFRAARHAEALRLFEWGARARPVTYFTPGFLYWAGRTHVALGQAARARQLFEETVQRFKHSYHGQRAAEALAELPHQAAAPPALGAAAPHAPDDVPAESLARLRELLLLERLEEALDELRALPPTPSVHASVAWLESRRGRLRPAINAMKRAYPGHQSAAADQLPEAVWRILYPIGFRDEIERAARAAGLDPALVAAVICQESTFEPGAVSAAGARGLMQVMPATGQGLARELGVRYRRDILHDPQVSLDFGTTYLRKMLDRYGGQVERALAAYNAGPHRVDAWTAARPDMPSEEFVESIPFTETRNYVMIILATREQYRRLHGLEPARPALAGAPTTGGRAQP